MEVSPLVLLFLATTGSAQEAPPSPDGLELGLRTGLALPFGKMDANADDLSRTVSFQVPIWIDLAYRITPRLVVGVYAQLGFVVHESACPGCSSRDWRFGANLRYHLQPMKKVDPWVGFGAGYEIFTQDFAVPGGFSGTLTGRGWEIANVQVGLDLRVARRVSLGPFVSLSFDEITSESLSSSGRDMESGDLGKTLHEWLLLGFRGRFDL
jgi:hypothetical protein